MAAKSTEEIVQQINSKIDTLLAEQAKLAQLLYNDHDTGRQGYISKIDHNSSRLDVIETRIGKLDWLYKLLIGVITVGITILKVLPSLKLLF